MQDRRTALIWALDHEHLNIGLDYRIARVWTPDREYLDVVNRLLDCKELDVNVQDKVSGIV